MRDNLTLSDAKRVCRQYGYTINKRGGEYLVRESHCTNRDHGAYEPYIEDAVATAQAMYRHGVSCCAKQQTDPGDLDTMRHLTGDF